jgi:glutamyl-tRNA synthetase
VNKVKKSLIDDPVWEDPILLKSDGFPTYHWANVCDDHDMKVTHVIRGSEWMSSTPLHVALYQALGWKPPLFSHVPLLVDHDGRKLSKRNFDSDIASFKRKDIFPETLTNFAALLGWSHQQKSDIMNLGELEALFDLKITKGSTIVAFEKLTFLQEHHARRRVNARGENFEQMIRDVAIIMLERFGARQVAAFLNQRKLRDVIASMLDAKALAYRSAESFVDFVGVFVQPLESRPPFECQDAVILKDIHTAASILCLVPENSWDKTVHRSNIADLQTHAKAVGSKASAEEKVWRGEFYRYLRWALLGGAAGPSLPETMEILGRATCLQRVQSAAIESRDHALAMTRPEVTAPAIAAG